MWPAWCGKSLVDLGRVFCTYLEPPNSHIVQNPSQQIGVRGKPERDMESLRMMGWGLVVVESSSAVAAAAVVAAAVTSKGTFSKICPNRHSKQIKVIFLTKHQEF